MSSIVEQLGRIYYTLGYEGTRALTELEIDRYYSLMIRHGRINIYLEGDTVIGFIESWRLNHEQLGKVLCWDNFNALEEDVTTGKIAYISDIWVDKEHRNKGIVKMLIAMFARANKDAEYFISDRVKNNNYKYVRVYDKETWYKHKELNNG